MSDLESLSSAGQTYRIVGFVYGTVGFLLSLLSVILAPVVSAVWLQSSWPRDTLESHKQSPASTPPVDLKNPAQKPHLREISFPRYRDFPLPPLTPVDEVRCAEETAEDADLSTCTTTPKRRPPPLDISSPHSETPNSLFSSQSETSVTSGNIDDAVMSEPPNSQCRFPPMSFSDRPSPLRLKRLVSRRSSFHSTSSHSSDDQPEKKSSKRDFRRLCPRKSLRSSSPSSSPEPTPIKDLRRSKTEASFTEGKRLKQEQKPKQPLPRTQPYEFPYFFPSPTSPDAHLYTQSLNAERRLRFTATAAGMAPRDRRSVG